MRNTQGFLPDPYFELTGFREEAISEKARGQGTRNVHSVPETPSYGTELTLGAQNSLLWYATRFQRHSVQKTGFYGTEGIFGTGNALLRHGICVPCQNRLRRSSLRAVTAQTQDYSDTLSINAAIITGTKECHKHPKTHQTHQML